MQPQEHRAAIAALSGHLGYRLLLSDIEVSFEDILANLAEANTDAQILHFGRLFQVFYRMRLLLKDSPEKFKDEVTDDLHTIRSFAPTDPNAPPFPAHRQQLLQSIEESIENGRPE